MKVISSRSSMRRLDEMADTPLRPSVGVRFTLPEDHRSASTKSSEPSRFFFDDESSVTNHLPKGWKDFIQPRILKFRDEREEENYNLQLASTIRARTSIFSALLMLSCLVEVAPQLMAEVHTCSLWGIPLWSISFVCRLGFVILEFATLLFVSVATFFLPHHLIEPCILWSFVIAIFAFTASSSLELKGVTPKSPTELALFAPANFLQILGLIVYVDFVYCLRPIVAIPLHVGSGAAATALAACAFSQFWQERHTFASISGEAVAINPYNDAALGLFIWLSWAVFIIGICVCYAGAYTVDLQRRIIFHSVPTLSPPLPFRTRKSRGLDEMIDASGASTGLDMLRTTNKEISEVVKDLRQTITTARHGSPGGMGHLDWLLPTIEEIERLQGVCVNVMTNAASLYEPVRSPKSPEMDDDVYAWVDHMCNVAADRRLQRGPTVRESDYSTPRHSSDESSSDSDELEGSLSPTVISTTTRKTGEIRDVLAAVEDSGQSRTLHNLYRPPVNSALQGKVGNLWNLNIVDLTKMEPTAGHILVFVGYSAIKSTPASTVIKESKNENRFLRLLLELECLYHPLSYHNKEHAATVCHLSLCLLNGLNLSISAPAEETLATLVAACAHDVGHIGRDNRFCANSKSTLSLVYNDRTILENYHCYLLFSLLRRNECNIFQSMNQSMSNSLRQWMIDLIFATDMAMHFSILSEFRLRREAADFDFHNKLEDRLLVTKLCLKLADIGHATLNWDLHKIWSARVQDEFFSQGDQERANGLPVSPLCDRFSHDLPRGQTGFLQVVVLPLVVEIDSLDLSGVSRAVKTQLLENVVAWQNLARDAKGQ